MTIYTGYFAQMKKYQELGLTPVSIARYSPRWFVGYCLKDLAPSDSLLKGYKDGRVSIEEYRRQYLQQLETVRWTEVLHRLERIAPDGAVLCCYEKLNDFCHRHILSEYMREGGYDVKELLVCKGKPPKGRIIGGSISSISRKGLLEALAQEDDGEPMDKNTAVDHDLGDVLKFVFGEDTVTCNRDCEKCRSLNGRAEKNGQPWGYECLKYGDTIERKDFTNTKTFRR